VNESSHPKHRTPLDVTVGGIFGSREGGGSIDIQEMIQSPTDRSLTDCDVTAGEYATPVVVLVDHDVDGSPIDVVAFCHDDNAYRIRLIDRAIVALEAAREALTAARHVEAYDSPLIPPNPNGAS